tara:strand:+ start:136 stop:390 length:255 start_codon:yes stop_codon:yes gene_type:complete
MLTLEQFTATRRTCDETTWLELVAEDNAPREGRDACLIYADGFMIHKGVAGQYFVHAWWYAPIAYDTLEMAESKLYPWYEELAA